ncbi:alpha/beta hydrolase [Thalassococcus sp. S3]|uniref:alpha/beta hydrolase n=1 Tax=Thalassococcus sp. S3 TaxID=2017482 RepID=UPI001024484F|nr:alpha/beta hydrolase [Thalassococcus sp. S3]QBF33594.1 esterase [Thalassococcus sp. S3]
MSLRARLLNLNLRFMEKPYLAKASDPQMLRQGFEKKARFWFRPPQGARFENSTLGDIPTIRATVGSCVTDAAILYFHGGGYVFGSPKTHRAMLAHLSRRTGLPAYLPAYRLAPEHCFPAAVEDALAAYSALIAEWVPASRIILGGDSAGGGLALSCLAEILREGLDRPAGCFALSPLADLTFSGASFADNAKAEVMLPAHRASEMVALYLNGRPAADPRATPLHAVFDGAPPVYLTAGDTEILLDDTRRMTSHLRAQNVEVTERIRRDLPHVWPIFHGLIPEAGETLDEVADWIRPLVPRAHADWIRPLVPRAHGS